MLPIYAVNDDIVDVLQVYNSPTFASNSLVLSKKAEESVQIIVHTMKICLIHKLAFEMDKPTQNNRLLPVVNI